MAIVDRVANIQVRHVTQLALQVAHQQQAWARRASQAAEVYMRV
jgi:hypothetical protein